MPAAHRPVVNATRKGVGKSGLVESLKEFWNMSFMRRCLEWNRSQKPIAGIPVKRNQRRRDVITFGGRSRCFTPRCRTAPLAAGKPAVAAALRTPASPASQQTLEVTW